MQKNRIFQVALSIISALSFFIALASPTLFSLVINAIVAILIGFLLSKSSIRSIENKIAIIVAFAISIGLSIVASNTFYITWKDSKSMVKLATMIGLTREILLTIACVLITILSTSFLLLVISLLIDYTKNIKELFNTNRFCGSIKTNIAKLGHEILNSVLVLILAITIGFLLLVGATAIQSETIDSNVAESAQIMDKEGNSPSLFSWCLSKLDFHADSIVLLETTDKTDDTIVHKAMLAYRGHNKDGAAYFSLINKFVNNNDFDEEVKYTNYWHGYLTYIKPLLLLFNTSGIRIVNFILQLSLVIVLIGILIHKKKKALVIPVIIVYLMLMPIVLFYSYQFYACFYISIIGSIVMLLNKNKKYDYLIFLIIGVATAYYDFLTYPIATLGMPLIFLLVASDRNVEDNIVSIIKCSIFWGLGYGLMWGSKWIVTNLFTDDDAISEALKSFLMRTSNTDLLDGRESVSALRVIDKNMSDFLMTPFTILLIGYMLCYTKKIKRNGNIKNQCYKALPYILISIYPLLWYIFAKNHSYIHSYFTCKGLMVTALALLVMLTTITNVDDSN